MIIDHIVRIKSKQKISSSREVVKPSEGPVRSLIKALTWRCIGTLDTLFISYLLTDEIGIASAIAAVDFMSKMVLYFFHERAWSVIRWGK